jgi:cbb3-type cytochrome oxidase subunit 3
VPVLDNGKKKKYAALLTAIVTIIVISPLDDIAIAALCGTALFGFGSTAFYLLMAGSSAASITVWMWRKHSKQNMANKATFPGWKS